MITIDGSFGEGGGQIVRSALALSLITGTAVTIENLRARRAKPGLRPQHLVAVRAAANVGRAVVEGDEIGSSRLVFAPQGVRGGEFSFRIGTAGSTTLVLQTVLPALLIAPAVSRVALEGGTHNPLAPPYEFFERVYLPVLRRMGHAVEARLERHGFYPAGGGRMTVTVEPATAWRGFDLLERGRTTNRRVRALVAKLPAHIGERECATAVRKLGWRREEASVVAIDESNGPGNVLLIELDFEHAHEVICGFGSKGVKAEKVAAEACREAQRFLDAGVPVGEHLADQLLLPLALGASRGSGGGSYRTLPLSGHALTQIEIVRKFLAVDIAVDEHGPDGCTVRVK